MRKNDRVRSKRKPRLATKAEAIDQIAPKPFVAGPVHLNFNVTINIMTNNEATIIGSNVGSFSQASIASIEGIETNIGSLKQGNSEKVAEALAALTSAIETSKELESTKARDELLDQLKFISDHALQPPEKRSSGVVKSVLSGFGQGCQALGGLAAAWQTWGPVITAHFGI